MHVHLRSPVNARYPTVYQCFVFWRALVEDERPINMAKAEQVDAMEGVEKDAPLVTSPSPLFTEQEQRVLDLYDRMEELQLEIALLKSQGTLSQGSDEPDEVSEEDIKSAQQELLNAKTAYQLRNNIVESVLIANPILKAVHSGSNATIAEQDLLPLLEQRDQLSVALTALTAKVLSSKNELLKVETEHIRTARENVELTGKMVALAKDANTHKRDDIPRKAQAQLNELDAQVKSSRQKWRIMKGTASGTIVGSGIDWARDPDLLEIVLDDDGADG
ncbi:hypothetical protein HYALB_00000053 [Hymenoscyphus albidus]|uniref:Centromere protein H C-terminal domain-containing protein n=1 Tax=Hymenoscyphus albidus TaxID=595503 RepID=A0A9N9Q4J5_9HELO|nr:hypothetical protein HYALB_00000053 [Hymenoscyphus albidus]